MVRSNNPSSSEKTETTRIPAIIGLDISTTCTAVCVLHAESGDLLKMYHVLMNNKSKYPSFFAKVEAMKLVFTGEDEPIWDVKAVAVEENAKRFAPGLSSADTIITLAKFNGILCYLLYEQYGLEPTYINVNRARKLLGIKIDRKDKSKSNKQKVMEQVIRMNPKYPWVYKTRKGVESLVKINEDRADAWVIAAAARMQT